MELGKLKGLLGISENDTSQDSNLEFVIDDVTEMVCNYCHIDDVPDKLQNTCYRMATDLFRAEHPGSSTGPLTVTSVSEGGSSTSFGSSTEIIKDTVLKNYKTQLNSFRKLGW